MEIHQQLRGSSGSSGWRASGASHSALVCFLGHAAHFGPDVSQQEEPDGCHGTGDLCYPEGRLPAMVFGDGAERQTGQEATN